MPKRDLFQKLNNPSSDIPLRPFDLSQRKLFSARVGMCIPTMVHECLKGDKFKISQTVFNRTDRLLAPAFFRCKQINHYFFVPYHTLWHEWDAFFTRSTEKLSAATLGSSYFPNFCLEDFLYYNETYASTFPVDMLGFDGLPGIDRMMQMLGYAGFSNFDSQTYSQTPNPEKHYCNLARILAYNKIWYWYYRDKRHAPTSLSWWNDFVQLYNVDDINASVFANSQVNYASSRLQYMFMPKYRTWDSDIFTNSFASTQFGAVSIINADKVQISNIVDTSGTNANALNAGVVKTASTDPVANLSLRDSNNAYINGSQYWKINNLFDILVLRQAEAVQHWRELMLRAGDSSKNRYRAMYGSNPKRAEEAPNYLGGFDVNLNIDDVTSSSIDNGSNTNGLGQLAGKGIMVHDNNTIEFTAPDYGILMCITSFLPLAEYNGDQVDKANTFVENTDWPIPQFDRLGFEPVILGEQTTYRWMNLQYSMDTIIGYTVRNHAYKSSVDRVYNNFRFNKSESYWSCVRNPQLLANPNLNYSLNYRQYYVSPQIVNPLFDRSVNLTTHIPDSSYNEDQFKCMSYFDIKVLRPLSELGLPPM